MANQKFDNLTEVGIGAVQETDVKPEPLLQNVSEFEYVTLMNPLPITFKGKVAQSRPVEAPMRIVNGDKFGVNDQTVTQSVSAGFKNPDHESYSHITSIVEIPSGQTLNLRGDEAKVIIRQLTDVVMDYEGNTRSKGSPTFRRKVEERLVVGRHDIDSLLGERKSERELIDHALAIKNEEEAAFPTLKDTPIEEAPAPPTKKAA